MTAPLLSRLCRVVNDSGGINKMDSRFHGNDSIRVLRGEKIRDIREIRGKTPHFRE